MQQFINNSVATEADLHLQSTTCLKESIYCSTGVSLSGDTSVKSLHTNRIVVSSNSEENYNNQSFKCREVLEDLRLELTKVNKTFGIKKRLRQYKSGGKRPWSGLLEDFHCSLNKFEDIILTKKSSKVLNLSTETHKSITETYTRSWAKQRNARNDGKIKPSPRSPGSSYRRQNLTRVLDNSQVSKIVCLCV